MASWERRTQCRYGYLLSGTFCPWARKRPAQSRRRWWSGKKATGRRAGCKEAGTQKSELIRPQKHNTELKKKLIFFENWYCFFNKLFLVKPLFYITLSGVVYIVATLLILKSITVSNASVAAAIESSYPIFTIFFVYIFLNEYQLNFMQLIGCLLIISGIIMIKFYTGR